MEIKLLSIEEGTTVSTTVNVDNLESEENLKTVLVAFIKFLQRSGAEFPDELVDIMEEYNL